MLTVSHKCEHHADRELSGEHEFGGKEDDQNQFDPEDQVVDRAERDLGTAEANVGIRNFGVAIEPLALALALAIEQFQALDGADGLDECRALLCAGLDGCLRPPP
jgi:hypothetical protein